MSVRVRGLSVGHRAVRDTVIRGRVRGLFCRSVRAVGVGLGRRGGRRGRGRGPVRGGRGNVRGLAVNGGRGRGLMGVRGNTRGREKGRGNGPMEADVIVGETGRRKGTGGRALSRAVGATGPRAAAPASEVTGGGTRWDLGSLARLWVPVVWARSNWVYTRGAARR